jgi:hypothetical protein
MLRPRVLYDGTGERWDRRLGRAKSSCGARRVTAGDCGTEHHEIKEVYVLYAMSSAAWLLCLLSAHRETAFGAANIYIYTQFFFD